jgi:hypothetical protein
MTQKRHKTNRVKRKYGFGGLTVSAWAIGAGMNPQTMEKMFRRQGIEIEPRRLYGIREFLIAVTGDKHAAEVRNLELDAQRKDREEKTADGQLVEWAWVEKTINEIILLPLTQAFDAAPDTVSREWIEKVLKPTLRGQIQKPKPAK